jgi:hypothetical protein
MTGAYSPLFEIARVLVRFDHVAGSMPLLFAGTANAWLL